MNVKFVKGLASQYNASIHGSNGSIYFATDTAVIYMGGVAYGLSTADKDKLNGAINKIEVTDENQLKITFVNGGTTTATIKAVSDDYNGLMTPAQKADLEQAIEDIEDLEEAIVMAKVKSTDKTITVGAGDATGTNISVNIDNETIVKDSDGKLSVASSALSVAGDKAITVTESETGKTVALKLADANKILSQDVNGLLATITLDYAKTGTLAGNESKEVIQLKGIDGAVISEVDAEPFLMDRFLKDVKLNGSILTFSFEVQHGGTVTLQDIPVDLSNYIKVYEAGNGINIDTDGDAPVIEVVVDETSEKYLTVGEGGVKLSGIDTAILVETNRAKGKEDELSGRIDDLEELVGDESVEQQISDALGDLALETVGGTGKVITSVSQEDGQLTATTIDLTAANVAATAVGDGTATTVQGILEELEAMWQWHDAD